MGEYMRLAIAIDVGATNLRVALGDEEGRLLKKLVERTTRVGDEYAVVNQISSMIHKLVSASELERVVAIGVGTIGPLDIRRGRVVKAPNLPFEVIELGAPLHEMLRKPVYILNDCVAAVWGEKIFGAGKNVRNLVYVTISTGIGAGVIVDDVLLLGKDGNAHEVGHTVVDIAGTMVCGCGKRGHWEAYCSGANIPKFAKYLMDNMPREVVSRSKLYSAYVRGELSAELVYSVAKEGDEVALKIVEEIGRINAIGFANIVSTYDPELITVGGSVVLKNPELTIPYIRKYIHEYTVNRVPEIILTPLGEDVVLYGALAAALKPPETLLRLIQYM